MKRLAKIVVLLLVLTLAISCFVACGDKTTIDISSDGYWVIDGVKTEHKAIMADDNPQCLDFYPLDDGTYAVGGGKAIYLSEIVVPSNYKGKQVTKIKDNAFSNFTSLTTITIPESVKSIEKRAFYGCSALESISIPDSVTSIGTEAFRGCARLIIYCEAESKPSGWEERWNYSNCLTVWDASNLINSIEEIYKVNLYTDNGTVYNIGDLAPWGRILTEDSMIIELRATGEVVLTSNTFEKVVITGTYNVCGSVIVIVIESGAMIGTIDDEKITLETNNSNPTIMVLNKVQ